MKTYLDLNSFAQNVFRRCDVHENDLRRTLAKTLFIRILSNYQGAYLLGERGMEAEMKVLLRSMCEATFALVACAKNAEFAKSYIRHNENERLKLINRLLLSQSGVTDSDERAEILKQRELLLKKKATGQIKTLKVWEIAETADMKEMYNTAYAHFVKLQTELEKSGR